MTFHMCKSGVLSDEVRERLIEVIRYLEEKGVSAIVGDCGFMMFFQAETRQYTKKPLFMSALAQLPTITHSLAKDEMIAIFTANGPMLEPMRDLIRDECGVDMQDQRYVIVGCEDVEGFEKAFPENAKGEMIDTASTTPGFVAKARQVMEKYPKVRCFLMECGALSQFSDALRAEFGVPVFDAITACDFLLDGFQDNARFGLNNWHRSWDGVQDKADLGEDCIVPGYK